MRHARHRWRRFARRADDIHKDLFEAGASPLHAEDTDPHRTRSIDEFIDSGLIDLRNFYARDFRNRIGSGRDRHQCDVRYVFKTRRDGLFGTDDLHL